MTERIHVTGCILLLLLICLCGGFVTAETFSAGSFISISTSASVQGTVNETVSMTRTSIGGGLDKAEFQNSYISVNPSGLSWHSHLSAGSDEKGAWVDYTRTGGLPRISWRQLFGR